MRDYNDILTVNDLIDLVAFLQGTYDVIPPRAGAYPVYPIPVAPTPPTS
jgi:hypothetical protein